MAIPVCAQKKFNGLEMNMGNLYRLSGAKTRSISPENFTGEKGKGGMAKLEDKDIPNSAISADAARDLGQGWKLNPAVEIRPGQTFMLAEIEGEGAIQHIWMTTSSKCNLRFTIIRIFWDDEKEPSVECPLGDFFCLGWNQFASINSLAVCVNPKNGYNCYWVMPFRKKCKITIENINNRDAMKLFYQIDYTLTEVPDDAAYFHAQFRRERFVESSVYTIVEGIRGKGQFVGLFLAYGVTNNGWWGEGEIKFFMDGDNEFPTICGTGAEDYFCGSYGFNTVKSENGLETVQYTEYNTLYCGMPQVIKGDGHYNVMQRFSLYRWHIMDPIRFEQDLKITIQDLGWRHGHRYLQQHSDLASVCYWYQAEPHAKFPIFPDWQALEVN